MHLGGEKEFPMRPMRPLIVLIGIMLTGTVAVAGGTAIINPGALPPACRSAAMVPVGAPAYVRDAAMTSVANCLAIVQLRRPTQPSEAGARSLAASVAPSMRMLDDVIQHGDLASKIIAEHAKADLLAGIAIKLTGSVAPVGTTPGDRARFQTRADYAYAVGRPWRKQAADAFREVTRLASIAGARALASQNPVVAYAVNHSRAATGTTVISRR